MTDDIIEKPTPVTTYQIDWGKSISVERIYAKGGYRQGSEIPTNEGAELSRKMVPTMAGGGGGGPY